MTMKNAVLIIGILAACGGSKKGDTTPTPPPDDNGGGTPPSGDTAGMVPAEKMDEIKINLDRKRQIVSRCLAIAVDNRELPKSTHGKLTLGFTISSSGHAGDIKVIKADFESKSVTDCVIKHVEEIQFPELPKALEWSYSYAFEAN
jgi:hypothetical protein